jgi:hypothetical protein
VKERASADARLKRGTEGIGPWCNACRGGSSLAQRPARKSLLRLHFAHPTAHCALVTGYQGTASYSAHYTVPALQADSVLYSLQINLSSSPAFTYAAWNLAIPCATETILPALTESYPIKKSL